MFTFNPLWKLLIDKGLKREDLRIALNLSPSTMAKMTKAESGEFVSLEVVHRICSYFNCQPNDVIEYIRNKENTESERSQG